MTTTEENKKLSQELIKEIGDYLLDGMTEQEACILVGYPYSVFKILKENNEDIRNFLEKKFVLFKHEQLKQVKEKKTDKNAQWLLEKLRPDEFGGKKGGGDTTVNIISAIIKQIQENDQDKTSIVREGTLVANQERGQENKGSKTGLLVGSTLK